MAEGYRDMNTARAFNGKLAQQQPNPFTDEKQYGIGAVLVGHRCFIFGGHGIPQEKIGIYDVNSKLWTSRAIARYYKLHGEVRMAFVVDDILYTYLWYSIIGTYEFMTLDLVTLDEWHERPSGEDLPQMGHGTSGSYIERRNEGVLFGGKESGHSVHVYKVEASSWYTAKTTGLPPKARYNHTTCCRENCMFVVGGRYVHSRVCIQPLELHVLAMEGNRFSWSTPKRNGYAPPGRFLFAASCTSGRMFVFGGFRGRTCFDIYSFEHNRWEICTYQDDIVQNEQIQVTSDWWEGTESHALVLTQQTLIVFGGFTLPICTPWHITPL